MCGYAIKDVAKWVATGQQGPISTSTTVTPAPPNMTVKKKADAGWYRQLSGGPFTRVGIRSLLGGD